MKTVWTIVIVLVVLALLAWWMGWFGTVGQPASATVNLLAQNDSGQSGSAVLTQMGESQVRVSVSLDNSPAGPQPVHIHDGSCATLGGVKYPLTNLTDGSSETVLDVSWDELFAGLPLAINAHKSPQEASVYVSCGDLPRL